LTVERLRPNLGRNRPSKPLPAWRVG
jgi:hypothetical protein